jgi:hypothetical protein
MNSSRHIVIACALLILLSLATAGMAVAGLESGDAAWTRRAESLDGRLAAAEPIDTSITEYRAELDEDPDSLEARWKTMRSLHYAIEFTRISEDEKDRRAAELVKLARESIDRLESREADDTALRGDDFHRARVYFWSAIAWGARAQRAGLLTIVRERVAGRIRDLAEGSLTIDPGVDDGGALRLLSRLHATLPRVPFVSGWVDRDESLALAERGMELASEHPGNRLILALILDERSPGRSDEARRLFESVATSDPRETYLAEDLAIREQARQRLDEAAGND